MPPRGSRIACGSLLDEKNDRHDAHEEMQRQRHRGTEKSAEKAIARGTEERTEKNILDLAGQDAAFRG